MSIAITIEGDQVKPNGEKREVPVGATVTLTVTSDRDDEVHAHLGEDDYTLAVKAGRSTSGRFTVDQPGSYELESHETGKIIVILNVR